jgi:hypothetical protein
MVAVVLAAIYVVLIASHLPGPTRTIRIANTTPYAVHYSTGPTGSAGTLGVRSSGTFDLPGSITLSRLAESPAGPIRHEAVIDFAEGKISVHNTGQATLAIPSGPNTFITMPPGAAHQFYGTDTVTIDGIVVTHEQ